MSEGADFAAGVAAATAEQAAETAATAEIHAVEAAELADIAIDAAIRADETAWNAQDAVAELRGEMLAGFDAIAGRLDGLGKGKGEAESAEPAPEPKEDDEKAVTAEPDEPKGYGSRKWFGGQS